MTRYSISSSSVPISRACSGKVQRRDSASACSFTAFTRVGARPALSLALMACAICASASCSDPGHQSLDRPRALVHSIFFGGAGLARPAASASPMPSRMPFCATFSASSISPSEISSEPPSTMTIESAEPLTTRSMVENSSCWNVGLRIQFPSTRPTRTAPSGPFHGTVGEAERGRRGHHAEDVGIVLLVGGQHGHEHLDFVLEPLGEQRPDRAVDQPAGQNLLVGGPALTLEKPAGDLAGGVGLFAILDGEGEERKGGDVGRYGDGGEYHRVAKADEGGAGGLLGQTARLDGQLASRELGFDPLNCHCCTLSLYGCLCCQSRVSGLGSSLRSSHHDGRLSTLDS